MTPKVGAAQTKVRAAGSSPTAGRVAGRRRSAEILDIARDVMTEEGVNGLSLAEVARRLGVQPPSLYKYFPSLMAIYDALVPRGAAPEPRGDARRHAGGRVRA